MIRTRAISARNTLLLAHPLLELEMSVYAAISQMHDHIVTYQALAYGTGVRDPRLNGNVSSSLARKRRSNRHQGEPTVADSSLSTRSLLSGEASGTNRGIIDVQASSTSAEISAARHRPSNCELSP